MPTRTKASPNGKSKATPKRAGSRGGRARAVAERAVDLPVGAVLEASDRVAELVGPFTERGKAQRQLESYRTRLDRGVKRTERRGATARRKATSEATKRRDEVQRRARRVSEQLVALRP